MNNARTEAILACGGDPTDEVWSWFVRRGPHGDSFSWGQSRDKPSGYISVEHLERVVIEFGATFPAFREHARKVVNLAIGSQEPEFVRRAIQVAAVVGSAVELEKIKTLVDSDQPEIAADARACVFYLKRRLKAEDASILF